MAIWQETDTQETNRRATAVRGKDGSLSACAGMFLTEDLNLIMCALAQ